VKLEAEDVPAEREALRRAKRRRREILGVLGGLEGVAVPVQHGDAFQMPERPNPPGIGQGQLRKADFP